MDLRRGVVSAVFVGALLQAAPALAAPANDAFADAQLLSGNSASTSGTTVGATFEPPNEPPHFTSGDGSVWYVWTAPETAVVELSACDATAPLSMQMYSGSTLAGLGTTEVPRRSEHPRCNGLTGEDLYLFNVVGGTTYRIAIAEFVGDANFTLTLTATPTPNDAFATPQDLGQDLNVDVDGTTVGATLEPGEPDYFGNSGDGDSVWYRWTAPKRTRVWIDNCNAASNSAVRVYTGTAVGSLDPVAEHFGDPRPPGCEGDGLFGGRDEFLATAGTTYMIRVYTDLYEEGTFHLRMREIYFDASLTQSASATRIKKGKTVTYRIGVKNLGTVAADPWVQLITTRPNKFAGKVKVKYLSMDTTNGNCINVKWFGLWPGGICKLDLAPGDSATIVAKVKPSESFSHWVAFDYAHGGDNSIDDEDRSNEDDKPATTTVKRKRKHHH